MADARQDWLVAAACCESPRPAVTLADLPRAHRDELIRFALVAAASSAFFIALTILLRPLPSRSLASASALPHLTTPAGVPVRLQNPSGARPPQTARRRAESLPAAYEIVSVEESPTVAPPRRRGGVSRFFRGVFRWTVQPIVASSDYPQ